MTETSTGMFYVSRDIFKYITCAHESKRLYKRVEARLSVVTTTSTSHVRNATCMHMCMVNIVYSIHVADVHMCIHVHICMYIQTSVYILTYVYMNTSFRSPTHRLSGTQPVNTYLYIYVYTQICIYVYVYVHTHINLITHVHIYNA